MNEIGVRIPDYNLVALENVKMATEKAPTRDELMEELSKKGINNLVELLDALMPEENETGGFSSFISEENEDAEKWLRSLKAPGRRMVLAWLIGDLFGDEG